VSEAVGLTGRVEVDQHALGGVQRHSLEGLRSEARALVPASFASFASSFHAPPFMLVMVLVFMREGGSLREHDITHSVTHSLSQSLINSLTLSLSHSVTQRLYLHGGGGQSQSDREGEVEHHSPVSEDVKV
jgi:hypothetical protein